MPGQVVGLALINALTSAEAAVTAYETSNKAALDALATKLALTPGTDFGTELTAVSNKADADRGAASPESDTSVLAARAATAKTNVDTAYAALSSTEKAQADKYVATIAAEATAKTAAATAVEQGAAIGGLDADATAAAALTNHGGTASDLYDEYVAASAADRTAIDTEFKDSSFYATFKATVAKDAAYADAVKATLAAKDALDGDQTTSTTTVQIHGVTVVGDADTTQGSAAAGTYVSALDTKTTADTTLANAQAADANVAAVKAIAAGYTAVNNAETAANDAIFKAVTGFNATHTDAKVVDLAADATAVSTVKETFFFGDKATTANDFKIASFGAGDSFVVGSGYTFNKGALSTGDNNTSEFFLVQNGKDTLVVLETEKYGSSDVAVDASTGAVTAVSNTDHAAIITLTGVNVADLTVSNGVVSHVA